VLPETWSVRDFRIPVPGKAFFEEFVWQNAGLCWESVDALSNLHVYMAVKGFL
jgi:hypothetical protein